MSAICDDCGCEYNPKRSALGYTTCIMCAELNPPVANVCIIEVNKSNPTITNDASGLVASQYTGRVIGSAAKTRDYVRLGSLK